VVQARCDHVASRGEWAGGLRHGVAGCRQKQERNSHFSRLDPLLSRIHVFASGSRQALTPCGTPRDGLLVEYTLFGDCTPDFGYAATRATNGGLIIAP